ncbi:hypothetical protein A2704_03665 [Candidatus Kaiserbacteria bacterium RIFCSPHIGHO2_01_FULL_54_36b]|uniref:Uncharacterized protein n=1 Tax=Candidatus Kaiserbacteria bacterium RIFCSPHIGHO2_01_FULL_54_36b TaxID=1798483 RepID=A0A1F6CMG4_9BACT|nr:MAG: hypothetical protein A2704_03665 [Candidatus Kaiserbacteria bacterium RIFCSPHIGHO2_01_FULL_54_36b]
MSMLRTVVPECAELKALVLQVQLAERALRAHFSERPHLIDRGLVALGFIFGKNPDEAARWIKLLPPLDREVVCSIARETSQSAESA